MVGIYLLILNIFNSSPLVITEVLANVKGSDSGLPGERNEFVEIFNILNDTIDLRNYYIYDFDPARADEIYPWTDSTILIKYPNIRIGDTKFYPQTFALILDRDYTRPDTGQYLQPYQIPDGTLIVTTDDHTICDGLSSKDPIIIYSADLACTTSFGTPYNPSDTIPFDPGDGISLERVEIDQPDSINNWWPSLDSSGSTPGKENSVAKSFDLMIDSKMITFRPATAEFGEDVEIQVTITNLGLKLCDDWKLQVFADKNRDSLLNPGEMISELTGDKIPPLMKSTLKTVYQKPSRGEHWIGARILFTLDKDTSNNQAFKSFWVVGKAGSIGVYPSPFSPDGDGIDDLAQIDYRLPGPNGDLTISIYDGRGIKVKDLINHQRVYNDHGTIFWNGTDQSNRITPVGIYIIFMEYKYENRTTRAKKTVALAKRKI
ncbi:MAG: hypothetical protein ABIL05_01970 [candidate division WOR-3 bacterium]